MLNINYSDSLLQLQTNSGILDLKQGVTTLDQIKQHLGGEPSEYYDDSTAAYLGYEFEDFSFGFNFDSAHPAPIFRSFNIDSYGLDQKLEKRRNEILAQGAPTVEQVKYLHGGWKSPTEQ